MVQCTEFRHAVLKELILILKRKNQSPNVQEDGSSNVGLMPDNSAAEEDESVERSIDDETLGTGVTGEYVEEQASLAEESNTPDSDVVEQASLAGDITDEQGNLDNGTLPAHKNSNKEKPAIKSLIQCKLNDTTSPKRLRIISRGGRKGGKYENWYNVVDVENDDSEMFSVNWDQVAEWENINEEQC